MEKYNLKKSEKREVRIWTVVVDEVGTGQSSLVRGRALRYRLYSDCIFVYKSVKGSLPLSVLRLYYTSGKLAQSRCCR